jgi:hypothetical protein
LLCPGLFFSFVIFFTQTVGLLGRVISTSQGRYLHTGQHKHRINAHTDIHAWVGFDTTIPASDGVKIVHALGHATTVIDPSKYNIINVPHSSVRSPTVCAICFTKHMHRIHLRPNAWHHSKINNLNYWLLYSVLVYANQSGRKLISEYFCPKFGKSWISIKSVNPEWT